MAKESRKSALSRYRGNIEHARKWRRQENLDTIWRDMIDMYRGKQVPDNYSGDAVVANMIFSTVNVIAPSVSINHPKITVQANRHGDDEAKAIIAEAVVNYWWRHYDFRKPFRRSVKDMIVLGHGWLKVGYKFVEEERPLPPDQQAQRVSEARAEMDLAAEADPFAAGELPTDEELASTAPATEMVVLEDRPTLERVSPLDVYVDPEATCLEDADWIAQRLFRPLAEVRKDKRYNPGPRSRVESDASVRTEQDEGRNRQKRDNNTDRVTVWEFYDIRKNTMCVFTEQGKDDEYLVNPQPMPYPFGHPFVFVPNYEVSDEFYPIGDVEQLIGLQQELNKTRTQMIEHRDQLHTKYIYRESAMTPQSRDALNSSEPGVAVPVDDDGRSLDDIIRPLPINPIPPDLYNQSSVILEDLNTVSGVSEYARGATPEIRRTATEAAIIQDAQNARAADKLAIVEAAATECSRRLLQLFQIYGTEEQIARITGEDGQDRFFSFTAEDVAGEFDFSVEGGSTQPNNETVRRQETVAMLNALAPFIGQVIDPTEMAKYALQYGFGIKSPEKFLMAPPPPEMVPPPGEAPGAAAPPAAPTQAPMAAPADAAAPMGAPAGEPDEAMLMELISSVPPEVLMQLAGQVGLNPTGSF